MLSLTGYAPAVAELLAVPGVMPLGPGIPNRDVADALRQIAIPAARDTTMAKACLAGLWLRFNYFDESHAVSQELHTPEGSAWHAILHRREPDAANSAYWWRQVGKHPVLDQLAEQSPALGYSYTTPFAFVEFCERVRDQGTDDEKLAERVQELEWRLLFDWCYRKAVG